MENLEPKPNTASSERIYSSGRESIPTEAALEAQKRLIDYMIPEKLKPHITNDINDPLLGELTMRWMEKYALKHNGFSEYCDDHADDTDFLTRVVEETLDVDDLESMKAHLEQSEQGGVFFTEEELADFMKQKDLT